VSERSVVISGVGAITPCGLDVPSTWNAVVEGRSPIGRLERFPVPPESTTAVGTVPGLEHELPSTSLAARFAHSALTEALADAGLADGDSIDLVAVGHHGERRSPTEGMPKTVSTAWDLRNELSDRLGASRSMAVFGACAAGGLAISVGFEAIMSRRAEVVVCVGVDAMLNDFDYFQFAHLYAMSTRECAPTEASCPFDSRRDGFVLSEGAAVLVLEAGDHAARRGARVRAVVAGVGNSQSAYDMIASPPDAEGPTRAIAAAIAAARVDPADVGYVNAHGTSTRDNDWCETLAIRRAFGPTADRLLVSSTKSTTGHLMAAAGALEAVLTLKALEEGVAPPTINYTEPDPHCDLDYVPNEARARSFRYAISNSFGFGGHNTAVLLGRPA
jgi:3-oxoacyl-[acyl-carrier-protein] synthase II